MIINPQINIPPDVSVKDPIRAKTTNDMLAALRQMRPVKSLERRAKNVFDLYPFSHFYVSMYSGAAFNCSGGQVYVHAFGNSPFNCPATTNNSISTSNISTTIYVKFDWNTQIVTVEDHASNTSVKSTPSILKIPLVHMTRYGDSPNYFFVIDSVLHIGDVHVSSSFKLTT